MPCIFKFPANFHRKPFIRLLLLLKFFSPTFSLNVLKTHSFPKIASHIAIIIFSFIFVCDITYAYLYTDYACINQFLYKQKLIFFQFLLSQFFPLNLSFHLQTFSSLINFLVSTMSTSAKRWTNIIPVSWRRLSTVYCIFWI